MKHIRNNKVGGNIVFIIVVVVVVIYENSPLTAVSPIKEIISRVYLLWIYCSKPYYSKSSVASENIVCARGRRAAGDLRLSSARRQDELCPRRHCEQGDDDILWDVEKRTVFEGKITSRPTS